MIRLSACMLIAVAGCRPAAPLGAGDVDVPRDATAQCASQCTQIGLPLDSVVIMANNVGCVCRAPTPAQPAAAPPGASASTGGMAAIMIAEQAARAAAARRAAANKPK